MAEIWRKKYKVPFKKISHRTDPGELNRTGGGFHKVKRNELLEEAIEADMADELDDMPDETECEMCKSKVIRYKKWGYWCESCGHEFYIPEAQLDQIRLSKAEWDRKYR